MKTTTITTLLIGIIMLFLSCHREWEREDLITPVLTDMPHAMRTEITTPDNPDNPYDSVGFWHNEVLAYIRQHRSEKAMPDEYQIQQLISDYALQHWGFMPTDTSFPITHWMEANGMETLHEEIIHTSDLTEEGKKQLHRVLETIVEHGQQDNGFSYRAFKESIMAIEQEWISNPALPIWDTSRLQMKASVARHSAYYWSNDGNQPTIEPTLPVNTHDTGRLMFSSIVRFIATVEWDMRGFTLGYIGGDLRTAAGKAAGASSWIYGFFDYGVTGGW